MCWQCIYCGGQDRKYSSRAHIFPASIGGRLWLEDVCRPCNAVIGHVIESKIKKTVFFAVGIEKLSIAPSHIAYRNVIVKDPTSGHRLNITKNGTAPVPIIDPGNYYLGSTEMVRNSFLQWVEAHRTSHLGSVKEQLSAGKNTIKVGSDKFAIRDIQGADAISVTGSVVFPYDVLAKIVYETMHFCRYPSIDYFRDFARTTFRIRFEQNAVKTIRVSTRFKERTQCLNHSIYQHDRIDSIDYRSHHRIDLRVSDKNTIYMVVSIFGVLCFVIALGKLDSRGLLYEELRNTAFALPIENGEDKLIPIVPGESSKWWDRCNIAADARWGMYLQNNPPCETGY